MKSKSFLLFLGFSAVCSAQNNTYPWPQTGNVGVGTTSPQAKLHVFDPSSNVSLRVQNNASFFELQSNGQDGYLNLIGSGNLYFRNGANADTRLTLTGAGNVGIGTSNPGEKLAVKGNIVADGGRLFSQVSSAEGGNLVLSNPSKAGATANNWVIWNMTAPYGNGLSFWRYFGDGTNAGPSVWFGDNASVGVGTTAPLSKLEVRADGGGLAWAGRIALSNYTADKQVFLGTYNSNSVVGSHNYALNAWTPIYVNTTDGSSTGANVLIAGSGNVGIGTANPTQKLSVNGTVRAKEVIVETAGWSDYVLAKNYALAPLSEVEQHIQKEGHLPGIPSAQEVAEKGVGVGEMQAKLLAKIEELTLHLIAQQKVLELQNEKIADLQAAMALHAAGK